MSHTKESARHNWGDLLMPWQAETDPLYREYRTAIEESYLALRTVMTLQDDHWEREALRERFVHAYREWGQQPEGTLEDKAAMPIPEAFRAMRALEVAHRGLFEQIAGLDANFAEQMVAGDLISVTTDALYMLPITD